jgi:DNA repair photolyase
MSQHSITKPVGRAARSNAENRFEKLVREVVDDGWGSEVEEHVLRTEVRDEPARKIITKNTSPDISFDRSINPYRGCEHGCIYCYARPSHAYLGLSPGLDFETKLLAKPNAANLLRAELSNPRYKPDVIAIGTNTDPYQPIEKDRKIMRGILEVLSEFRHPVGIATKGTLIERDCDILGEMGQAGLARVGVSITTLDAKLARVMEPRVPSPARRLRAIERLAAAGCPVRVMVSPIVPGLTDHEIENIVASAKNAGAVGASAITLRLPREVSDLFQEWLLAVMPDRASRVMARIREMHGGSDYVSDWGTRFTGKGVGAKLIQDRFKRASKAAGLARYLPKLRTDLFVNSQRGTDQLDLFA